MKSKEREASDAALDAALDAIADLTTQTASYNASKKGQKAVIATDVDGTLRLSGGPIFTETLEELERDGNKVVIVSPSVAAQGIWDRFDRITAPQEQRDGALRQVKRLLPGYDRYVYVSDNIAGVDPASGPYRGDEENAKLTGFDYINPLLVDADTPEGQADQILRSKKANTTNPQSWYTDGRGRHRRIR